MKYRILLVVATLMWLFSPAALTITLKFSPETILLAVDGKPLPSTLFKSADSLELSRGLHQILLRIEKFIPDLDYHQGMYISRVFIIVFNTKNSTTVTINIPNLNNEWEIEQFEQNPTLITLMDNQGYPIKSVLDIFPTQMSLITSNYQQAIRHYNLSSQPASLPQLVQKHSN